MGERYTSKDVDSTFGALVREALEAGVTEAQHWIIQGGSAINGQMYRLYLRNPGETGMIHASLGLSDGYLGATAKEAHIALMYMLRGINAVNEAKRSKVIVQPES